MGRLRDRMEADLKLKGYSPHTQRCYLRRAQDFAEYHGRSPAVMGEREVKSFLMQVLQEKGVAPATLNMYVASLKFMYVVTLRQPDAVKHVSYSKVPLRLPQILPGTEVERLLACITSITYRTMTAVSYGAGFRITEVCRLRSGDIDSVRKVIHVREGKGRKAREVMLGDVLLGQLRDYWRAVRPRGEWLFPSPAKPDQPISDRALRQALTHAARRAGIKTRVTPHTLRHCFATHLVELGYDTVVIQQLLGHAALSTTRRYAQVSAAVLRRVKSPLDVLGKPEGEVLR